LEQRGTFIVSTPNGEISALDADGKPIYPFHNRVYTASDLKSLVSQYYGHVELYGQWLTYVGKLRKIRAKELFEQLCEAYFNPMSRIGRIIKRVAGKKIIGPPESNAAIDSLPGDYEIWPFESNPYPWPPIVLLAVCKKQPE
jgi:hypothetical protein